MSYVYLIRSRKNGSLYIGFTVNLRRRLAQHNQGGSRWTKSRAPFELVYYEAYRSFEDARMREKRLKQFKKGYTELKKRLKKSIELACDGGGG